MLNRSYWIPAAFIVWMMFVLATFYAVQKPITAEDIAALAEFPRAFEQSPSVMALFDALLNGWITCLLVVVAVVSGFRLCALPYPHDDGSLTARAEFWLLASGVGFGAMALVTFGLSL